MCGCSLCGHSIAHAHFIILCVVYVQVFHTDHDDMLEDLEQGDVAETVKVFFEKSQHVQPAKKSTLFLQDVSVHNAVVRP